MLGPYSLPPHLVRLHNRDLTVRYAGSHAIVVLHVSPKLVVEVCIHILTADRVVQYKTKKVVTPVYVNGGGG